jgi:hypothetical protein
MPRPKGHPEFAHLNDEEYQRAVNRLNATNAYRRKQIKKLREKLALLEGPQEHQSQQTEPIIEMVLA